MDVVFETVAQGLRFPEGPIARPDGSVLFVEIARGTLTRWHSDEGLSIVSEVGGGPNGAAIGPDGAAYICNNGGFEWHEADGSLLPVGPAKEYVSGSIQRVDLSSGICETLYDRVGEHLLSGPNDIVFDRQGGMWFTDLGKSRAREAAHGGLYYARADGSEIKEVVYPVNSPNGIGLSADEKTLYVALTWPRTLLKFDIIAPGILAPQQGFLPGTPVGAGAAECLFDSLALQADGVICVGTLVTGGITSFDPGTGESAFIPTPDPMATNICFGGPDLRTAYITCSTTGRLLAARWPVAGQRLNFYDA